MPNFEVEQKVELKPLFSEEWNDHNPFGSAGKYDLKNSHMFSLCGLVSFIVYILTRKHFKNGISTNRNQNKFGDTKSMNLILISIVAFEVSQIDSMPHHESPIGFFFQKKYFPNAMMGKDVLHFPCFRWDWKQFFTEMGSNSKQRG